MPEIKFKFALDQKVETSFGSGIINTLGHDKRGNVYYVDIKSATSRWSRWTREDEIKPEGTEE